MKTQYMIEVDRQKLIHELGCRSTDKIVAVEFNGKISFLVESEMGPREKPLVKEIRKL